MHEYFNYNIKGKNEDITTLLEKISDRICEDAYEDTSIPRFLLENSSDLMKYWDESKKKFLKFPKTETSITIGDVEEMNYGGKLDFEEINDFMIQHAKNLNILGEYANSTVSYEICVLIKNGLSKQIDNFQRDEYLEDLCVHGDKKTRTSNPWFGEDFEDLFDYAERSGIDIDDLNQFEDLIEDHEFSGLREILEKAFIYECEPLSDSIEPLLEDGVNGVFFKNKIKFKKLISNFVIEHAGDDKQYASYDEGKKTAVIRVEVKGTQHEGRSSRIEKISVGKIVNVVREPNNPYNSNNLAVYNTLGESLGNLSAELGNALSPLIDGNVAAIQSAKASYVEPLSQRSKNAKKAILYVELAIKLEETRQDNQ